jgi:zinc transport system permease protein
MDLLRYDFMIRALVGALVIGLVAPTLGIYLVQRRLSLIGDGIGHVALTGVGVGLLLDRSPVVSAVIVSVLGAVGIELLRQRGRTSGDLALTVLFYGGIAGGVVLVGLSDSTSANLAQYLFGSLTTTSRADLVVIGILGAIVFAAMTLLRPALFAVSHDEEYARVSGLPVRTLNLILAATTAVTVTIAMRTVGLLLISALMVVPVVGAQQVSRGFTGTLALAVLIGVVAAGAGVAISGSIDTAPGATIVILTIGVFLALAGGGALWRARRPAPATPRVDAEPPDMKIVVP